MFKRFFFVALLPFLCPTLAHAQMCGVSHSYAVTGNDVVLKSAHASPTDAMIADPDITVAGADGASFKPFDETTPPFCGSPYAKDKYHVYYMGKAISDDVGHFTLIKHGAYYTYGEDGAHMYIAGTPVSKNGFQIIENAGNVVPGYIKTADGVYTAQGEKIKGDAASIEDLGCNVTRDKSTVYFYNQPLQQVDTASFVRVTDAYPQLCYFKDANKVYWSGGTRCDDRCNSATLRKVLGDLCTTGCRPRLVSIDKADPETYFTTTDIEGSGKDAIDKKLYPLMYLKVWNSHPVD